MAQKIKKKMSEKDAFFLFIHPIIFTSNNLNI